MHCIGTALQQLCTEIISPLNFQIPLACPAPPRRAPLFMRAVLSICVPCYRCPANRRLTNSLIGPCVELCNPTVKCGSNVMVNARAHIALIPVLIPCSMFGLNELLCCLSCCNSKCSAHRNFKCKDFRIKILIISHLI